MNKLLKRGILIFFALVLIYAGLRMYLNYKLKQVLISQVEQFAYSNYKLDLGSIDIGWWAYNAQIHGLKLIKFKSKVSEQDKYHFTISALDVKLKGLYLYDLLLHQQLQLKKLEIINPSIIIDYNDTINASTKNDSSLVHLYYKLSKIILKNAHIEIKKSSGENLNLKSKLLDYDFNQSLLKIENIKYTVEKSSIQHFDAYCNISKASLFGFDLNILMNESNFKFSTCTIDSFRVKLIAHNDSLSHIKNENSLLQKLKSKSNLPLNPVQIKHIQFIYQSKYNNINASATKFNYNKNNLNLENIVLNLNQQHLVEASIERLSLYGFNVDGFIHNQHIGIATMAIIKPIVKIDLMVQKNYNALVKSSHEAIGYMIDSIQKIEIVHGSFSLRHHHKKNVSLKVNSIELLAKGANTRFFEDEFKQALVRSLTFKTGAVYLNLANNLYHFNIKNIAYNLNKETLKIDEISVKPNPKKSKFHSIVKKQIAMIDLDLKTLSSTGLNLNNLIRKHAFACDEIYAKQLRVLFYKDKNIPLLETDIKKFPQELLRELNYPLMINKLHVTEAILISEILNPGANNIAQIKVDQVQATINHIDNGVFVGNKMNVVFEGRIFSAGLLKAKANFDMYAADYNHTIHAEIGSMPFKYLNDFMFDFAGIEINRGILDKAIIDINGNRKKIKCKLDLSYHDLSMDILRNQNRKHKRYRNVASILANAIIYNHNPEPGKPLRSAMVEQAYITNKFVVGNWINASLKAMLITTAPKAANALQINNLINQNDTVEDSRQPNWLKRFLAKKKIK
jgi:hypothetical protein